MIENTFGMNIIPENESERLVALKRYRIMDSPSESSFDNIANLCTQIFNVPISLVSLVDADRVFFKANIGMGKAKETDRGKSLCSLAVLHPEITVFEDALKEPCLIANPNVAGNFGLRFYAGAPLITHDGFLIGTLCIIDKKPRKLSEQEGKILSGMALAIMDQIELRISAIEEIENYQKASTLIGQQQHEMQEINEELTVSNEEIRLSQEEMAKILQKLVFSESRFRKLVSEAPVAIATYSGKNLVIEQANEQMLRLWNKTESVIGLPLLQARPEMNGHPYLKVLHDIFVTGEEHRGLGIKGPAFNNGEVIEGYFDAVYRPLFDEKGLVTGIMAVASDVTEKTLIRLREQGLLEELTAINEELSASNAELEASQQHLIEINDILTDSESRFRNLIKEAPVAIATLKGRELVIDCVNDMILKIWGKDTSVVDKPLSIALPELLGQPFLDILDEVYRTGKPYYGNEVKVALMQDGILKDMFINFTYQPIGAAGKKNDIMVVAIDVSEQVYSRKAVEGVNQRLEIALDASRLGSTEVDLDTGIMQCNEQFKANFGYSKDQAFNYPDLINTILPEHRDRIKGLVQTAIESNSVYQAEYPVKWKNGSVHWISAHGRPLYDDHGKVRGMVGMTADITESKLFEQRKDDFLSIASHELKTPLTSLKASLQLLDRIKGKPTSAAHINLIDQANRNMGKMNVLVNDLLNMNRMTEGQLKLEKTTFTVSEMLGSTCNHVRMEGIHKLIIEGDKTLQVHADEHRIEQVVVNFVNNAVKYAPNSKEIYLKVEKSGDSARVSVRDTGPGIASHILPNLYDRYYRGNYEGRTYSGLGLGLYICSEIIKRHGGKVGVESEVGKGSIFWFTIPINIS